jgi:hypothetical protein
VDFEPYPYPTPQNRIYVTHILYTLIGEHSDIIETIEKELDEIARYQDHLDIIKKYFG